MFDSFFEKPWRPFMIAGAIMTIPIYLYRCELMAKSSDVLVEGVGFLLDIILFGIIITVYNSVREKRIRVREYHEQLQDYSMWSGEEGVFRKTGILKRLIDLNAKPKDSLTNFLMPKAWLNNIDLSGMHFVNSDFSYCMLNGAKFRDCIIEAETDFIGSRMTRADFSGSIIRWGNFEKANLTKAIFTHADLEASGFYQANLNGTDFTSATTVDTNFRDTDLTKTIGLTQEQINVARTRGATLPEGLVHGEL